MNREVEGYSIEVCGDPNNKNVICDTFSTWEDVIDRLKYIVQEKIDEYDTKPICLLRVSSQQACEKDGVVNVYSFIKIGITIQVRAIFKRTSFLPVQPIAQSSSVN
jgi:hypothetical protein